MSTTNKKIKIVFILPALAAGGAERVLITLMNNIDRARFEPVFITVSDEGPLRDIIAPDIAFHSLQGRRVSFALPKLYSKLKELKPDIVISTMVHMNLVLLLLMPFFSKTRFIVREAVTPSFILEEHPRISLLLRFAYKFLYSKAAKVISPAQAIIDEFKSLLGMSCENHVRLLNPVDIGRIRADEDKVFEVTGERKSTVHFIAAGRLHSQKGFDRLIEALPKIKHPHDWKLTILGEGGERAALEALIKEKGLTDKITLPGLSSNPWPDYTEADCFVMPSRWEGLPNVILESLACGTPAIATHESGGIAEIAALAPKGTVTVVDNMPDFLKEMEKVVPNPTEKFRKSLLPDEFCTETVVAQFSEILESSIKS